jgi:3-oxoacyl-[acyl-carrier protein] reductase
MNIIVTGASRGIGYELVKKLSGDDHIIIAISRNAAKLDLLRQECERVKPGIKVVAISCDLNDNSAVSGLPDKIKTHCDVIDVIINNAGAIVNKPFHEITHEDLQYVYNVNVFGVIHLIQKLLPMMNTANRSHIVNISSMGGFQGSAKFAGLSAYSSSKAALACLTECLAEEFKERNIAFNCLALGAAQTEMLSEAFPGYKAPLSASEMAAFIADFALKNHHFMNGKVIPVSMSTP